MFTLEASQLLDRVTLAYKEVCLSYIAEVGKLGAQNNSLTVQWLAKSDSGLVLRKLLRELKRYALDKTRTEKYYILRELYALKPGVHERFYHKEHEGRVLSWLQNDFKQYDAFYTRGAERQNVLDAKTTIFLKSVLALENFYDLPPLFDCSSRWIYPATAHEAQQAVRALLEKQDWKSLEQLKPLDSWMNYAPCSLNEGPFVKRGGKVLFLSLKELDTISISYQQVLHAVFGGESRDST